MKSALSASSRKQIETWLQKPTLFVFDFDGTLAPITRRPERAATPASTRRLLEQLASEHAVAVLSGRSRKDLKERLGFEPDSLVGNHGAEGLPGWDQVLRRAQQINRHWREDLERGAQERPWARGVFIEDKIYSLTLHYRETPHPAPARRDLLERACQLVPSPRIVPAKCALNLIPSELPHKGHALQELLRISGFERAIYLGDDETDEDVFRLGDDRILGIRIGKNPTAARYRIERQGQVREFLSFLKRASSTQIKAQSSPPKRQGTPKSRAR